MGGPPENITPARLFRIFLRAPRATLPVELPPLFGPSCGALFVSALTPSEENDAWESAASVVKPLRAETYHAELVARSLLLPDGSRAFRNRDELLSFDESDYYSIVGPCLEALRICAPAYRRSDSEAWIHYLARGALEYPNIHRACALAWCADWSSRATVPRPDRFFGVPMADVTDGQWMAWRAAKRVVIDSKQDGE